MIKIVYQKNGNGTRYAGLTINQLAKAMHDAWRKAVVRPRNVQVDFQSDTSDIEDLGIRHGILLQEPFGAPLFITSEYGGYGLAVSDYAVMNMEGGIPHGMGVNSELKAKWGKRYPNMTRDEIVFARCLGKIIKREWKDGNGLLWCEVKGCIEDYLELTLPESELEVINNF